MTKEGPKGTSHLVLDVSHLQHVKAANDPFENINTCT